MKFFICTRTSGAFQKNQELFELPKTFLKVFEFRFYCFLTAHSSLRKFVRMTAISEVDPEFLLKPKEISFQDSLDPKLNDKIAILKTEFLFKTPGFLSIYCINNMRIEMNLYHKQRMSLPYSKSIK